MKNKFKGFTLIELLVVIAIIGILAGMIFVSMGTSQNRAKDARVRSDLDQIRSKAVVLNDDEGNYGNVKCSGGDTGIGLLCDDLGTYAAAHNFFLDETAANGGTNTAYCGYASLSTGNYWCIDSDFGYDDVGDSAPVNCTAADCNASDGANNCTGI